MRPLIPPLPPFIKGGVGGFDKEVGERHKKKK